MQESTQDTYSDKSAKYHNNCHSSPKHCADALHINGKKPVPT